MKREKQPNMEKVPNASYSGGTFGRSEDREAKEFVLDLYGEGEISLGKAAEVLNCTPHDILRMVHQKGMRTGPSPEQVAKSGETLQKLTESV